MADSAPAKKKKKSVPPPASEKFAGRTLLKTLTLPSRGLLYEGPVHDSGGKVQIAAFTTREEKIFAGSGEGTESKIDLALDACVDAAGMTSSEFLSADALFLLFNIRRLSYGKSYGMGVKCEGCSKQYRYTLNLPDDLELDEAPDSYREPISLHLPYSKKTLSLKLFRRADEAAIVAQVDRMARKGHVKGDVGYFIRLARHIVAIDGAAVESPAAGVEFVQSMEGPDSLAFRNALDSHVYGYNLELELTCPLCGHVAEDTLDMNREFFRPKS